MPNLSGVSSILIHEYLSGTAEQRVKFLADVREILDELENGQEQNQPTDTK